MTLDDALRSPLVRNLLERANAEVLAADARASAIEARFIELRERVLELAASAQGEIAAAEARAKAAEDRLTAVMSARETGGRMAASRFSTVSALEQMRKAG